MALTSLLPWSPYAQLATSHLGFIWGEGCDVDEVDVDDVDKVVVADVDDACDVDDVGIDYVEDVCGVDMIYRYRWCRWCKGYNDIYIRDVRDAVLYAM